ncbi:putative SPX domain-containing protein [Seiridium cardinale]|uniref:SPX domain-containing protein n=1 Tax=Seiridium cardinale TaxID=138064 RepID=A0ABR2Y809_9PEZI
MKYGDYFEAASVPRWSLHNVDYNSLKQQIKLHTTKGQARAMTIPGQANHALERFENDFYHELHVQHQRVDLFVASKADEISRRLTHLAGLINALVVRCTIGKSGVTDKRQRKFAKFQRQVVECGDDIRDLRRFVRAQNEAFRKILKKYKKWTGSTTLTTRFRDNILGDYKSFTRRDFNPLEEQYKEVLATLPVAFPGIDSPVSQSDPSGAAAGRRLQDSRGSSRQSSQAPATPQYRQPEPVVRGWNEYDNGSEAGDESYYIELDPNDESSMFPGMDTVKYVLNVPVKSIRSLFSRSSERDVERQSLLGGDQGLDYFSVHPSAQGTDTEASDNEDASSAELPARGYAAHYAALPSVEDQRMERLRETVLHRSIVLSYLMAVVLTVIAGVLVATGRHKLRLEVDAGVILAVVVSLFAGCMGLGAMLYRQDRLSFLYQAAVWVTFIAVCLLNGMLLVLVLGSNGI